MTFTFIIVFILSQWTKVDVFSAFVVENNKCLSKIKQNAEDFEICYPQDQSLDEEHLPGVYSLRGRTGPRFEMIILYKNWLLDNYLR